MKKNLKLRYKKDKNRKRDMGDRVETQTGLGVPCSILHTRADKKKTIRNSKRQQKIGGKE